MLTYSCEQSISIAFSAHIFSDCGIAGEHACIDVWLIYILHAAFSGNLYAELQILRFDFTSSGCLKLFRFFNDLRHTLMPIKDVMR